MDGHAGRRPHSLAQGLLEVYDQGGIRLFFQQGMVGAPLPSVGTLLAGMTNECDAVKRTKLCPPPAGLPQSVPTPPVA